MSEITEDSLRTALGQLLGTPSACPVDLGEELLSAGLGEDANLWPGLALSLGWIDARHSLVEGQAVASVFCDSLIPGIGTPTSTETNRPSDSLPTREKT